MDRRAIVLTGEEIRVIDVSANSEPVRSYWWMEPRKGVPINTTSAFHDHPAMNDDMASCPPSCSGYRPLPTGSVIFYTTSSMYMEVMGS